MTLPPDERCDATLLPSYKVEVSAVPHMICTGYGKGGEPCEATFDLNMGGQAKRVQGTVVCLICGTGTGFQLERNIFTYISGRSSYGTLPSATPPLAKSLFAEAESCFLAAAPDGAAALCRASIEVGLAIAGYPRPNLYEMIEAAQKAKALDYEEVGMAHASRLVTRNAIHNQALVDLAEVPAMLVATLRILSKLFSPAPK